MSWERRPPNLPNFNHPSLHVARAGRVSQGSSVIAFDSDLGVRGSWVVGGRRNNDQLDRWALQRPTQHSSAGPDGRSPGEQQRIQMR